MLVATHDGPFHADDVMAFALTRTFLAPNATVVRTRDPERHREADLVVDVGGVFDPATGRFDHHQATYQGPRSSAGMVLDWLIAAGHVEVELGDKLRSGVVDYLDAVDNGRTPTAPSVPCFPRIVEALNGPATTHAEFDAAYLGAVAFAEAWLKGLRADHEKIQQARRDVLSAMDAAARAGTRVIELTEYLPWKSVYFEAGGATHPTTFVLHPGTDGSWRLVAIPPALGDFGQKVPLPEAWAGLTDEALEAVTGVPGSVFCHKNRFIAVFRTRDAAVEALVRHGLW